MYNPQLDVLHQYTRMATGHLPNVVQRSCRRLCSLVLRVVEEKKGEKGAYMNGAMSNSGDGDPNKTRTVYQTGSSVDPNDQYSASLWHALGVRMQLEAEERERVERSAIRVALRHCQQSGRSSATDTSRRSMTNTTSVSQLGAAGLASTALPLSDHWTDESRVYVQQGEPPRKQNHRIHDVIIRRHNLAIENLREEIASRLSSLSEIERAVSCVEQQTRPLSHHSTLSSAISSRYVVPRCSSSAATSVSPPSPPTKVISNEAWDRMVQRLHRNPVDTSSSLGLPPLDRHVVTVRDFRKSKQKENTQSSDTAAACHEKKVDATVIASRLAVADVERRKARQAADIIAAKRDFKKCSVHKYPLTFREMEVVSNRCYAVAEQREKRRAKRDADVIAAIDAKAASHGSGRAASEPPNAETQRVAVQRLRQESDEARDRRLRLESEYAQNYSPIGSAHAPKLPSGHLSHVFKNLHDGFGFEWRSQHEPS